jgi:predicted Zn-dependent protease
MLGKLRIRFHLLLLLTTTVLLGGCGSLPLMISEEQEIALGEEAAPQFEADLGGRVQNEQIQMYVQEVGMRAALASGREVPWEFTVVYSDVPNAMALPGGKIFLTAGLMQRMTNERQLAAVLSHEVAHVAQRHNVKFIQEQLGWAVLAEIIGAVDGTAGAAAQIATTMLTLRYSRENEYEADAYGIEYMAKVGYNPYGMVELLTVLLELHETEPGRFEEMFQTHPLTSERIETALAIIEDNEDYRSFSPDAPDPHAGRFLQMRGILLQELANRPPTPDDDNDDNNGPRKP